jgi:lipopolysaccharide/colanic/teichoic acid biosynthesis glycosyltransferase
MPDGVQRVVGLLGSLVVLPLIAVLAVLVRMTSPGPSLYLAIRIGAGGRPFTCYKLRTMRWDADSTGPAISTSGDPRITALGSVLRRTRLDELPQLWNVVRGEMRLVGPRPEAREFADLDDPLARLVFAQKPGITGAAQLLFADEAAMLVGDTPATVYRERILPSKLLVDAAYLAHRSWRLDLWLLGRTVLLALGRPPRAEDVRARVGLPGAA